MLKSLTLVWIVISQLQLFPNSADWIPMDISRSVAKNLYDSDYLHTNTCIYQLLCYCIVDSILLILKSATELGFLNNGSMIKMIGIPLKPHVSLLSAM